MKQLNIQDAGFIYQESENTPMHIGGVGIYDQTTSQRKLMGKEELFGYVEERIHLASILKQKLLRTPGDWLRPYWTEAADLDLNQHIHYVRLPAPGNKQQLHEFVSEMMSTPMNMDMPLWQVYIIEGLNDYDGVGEESFAILTKVHHSCIDGVTSAKVLAVFNDLTPDPAESPLPQAKDEEVGDKKGFYETLSRDYAQNVISGYEQTMNVSRKMPALAKTAFDLYRGRMDAGANYKVPATRFNQSPGKGRVTAYTRFSLGDVKAIKNVYQGTTVNDVMICIVAGALRKYLEHHGELSDLSLGAAIPKNLRTAGSDDDSYGNKVGGLFTSIHSNIADPAERLYAINYSMGKAKQFAEEVDTGELFPAMMGGFLSPRAGKAFARFCQRYQLMDRLGPVVLNTLITNVPGPNFPIYHSGAKMVDYVGMLPLTAGVSLGHAIYSYCDSITLSVMACPEVMGDVDFYLQCCDEAFDELLQSIEYDRDVC